MAVPLLLQSPRWRIALVLIGFFSAVPLPALAQALKPQAVIWQEVEPPPPVPVASDKVSWEPVSSEELGNSVPLEPIWLINGGIKNAEASKESQETVVWVVLDQDQEQQFEDSLKKQFASEPQLPDDVEVIETTQYPTPEQIAQARFRGSDSLPFRSVSRSIVYGETLYPEMGFWIPSAFRQSEDYRFTLTGQLLGNPTNNQTPDWCNWEDFWSQCSDSQYLLEVTPLIGGPISVGLNYSQQESFLGERTDGGFDQAGQALGFSVKSNLGNNFGAAVVGQHLWSPYDDGGPNGSYPNEEVNADLGRSYLWLGSAAWDLGFWFGADTPAVLAVTGGIGNGRYKDIKDTQRLWINYGPYGPVGTIALALNSHISFFAEWSGQYNGFGLSVKPLKEVPVTGTLMFRDFQNTSTGIVNCQGGEPDNCRTTLDGRLTISF